MASRFSLFGAVCIMATSLIVVMVFLHRRRSSLPVVRKDLLTLTDVVSFFKQPLMVEKLKKDTDLTAVAIRELVDGGSKIVLCLFDRDKNIVDSHCAQMYMVAKIDDDLARMFGEKDMIVMT